jgi:hypothetical protein
MHGSTREEEISLPQPHRPYHGLPRLRRLPTAPCAGEVSSGAHEMMVRPATWMPVGQGRAPAATDETGGEALASLRKRQAGTW